MSVTHAAARFSAAEGRDSSEQVIDRAFHSIYHALVSAVKIPLPDRHALEVSYTMKGRKPHMELRFITPHGYKTRFPLIEIAHTGGRAISLKLITEGNPGGLEVSLPVVSEKDLSLLASELKKVVKSFLIEAAALAKSKNYSKSCSSEDSDVSETSQSSHNEAPADSNKLSSLNLFDEESFTSDNIIEPANEIAPLSI